MKKWYSGCLGRRALIKPLSIISATIAVVAGVLYMVMMRCAFACSRQELSDAKKTALEAGNNNLAAKMQHAAEMLNLGYAMGAILVLLLAITAWLAATSPYLTRRMRDAGLRPVRCYAVALLPAAITPWLYSLPEGLKQMEYDAAMAELVLRGGVMMSGGICSALLLLVIAFINPTRNTTTLHNK